MFICGIASISFRSLSAEEVIAAAADAGLGCIEWGSDVHVPAGDLTRAAVVAALTRARGLECSSYGTYFRLGVNRPYEFKAYLDTAQVLGVDTIRIWGYDKGSAEIGESTWQTLVAEARQLCDMAAPHGITLSLECHRGTLTDDYTATLRFLEEVGRENLRTYWQPRQDRDYAYNMTAAEELAHLTTNVHVFHWIGKDKLPLSEGRDAWFDYLGAFLDREKHHLLLEFMPDGRPESLPAEAATLRRLALDVRA